MVHGAAEIGAIRTWAGVKLPHLIVRSGWGWLPGVGLKVGWEWFPLPLCRLQSLTPFGERFQFRAGNINNLHWRKGWPN